MPRPPRSRTPRGARPTGGQPDKGPRRGPGRPSAPRRETSPSPARPIPGRPQAGREPTGRAERPSERAAPRPRHTTSPVELAPPALFPLPGRGDWLYTCREGFEHDVAEELVIAGRKIRRKVEPRLLTPAVVCAEGEPPRRDRRIELTFARQAFPVGAAVVGEGVVELAARAREALVPLLGPRHPFVLHTFVPDSDAGNRLAGKAQALHQAIEERIDADPSLAERRGRDPRALGGRLAQVCLVDPGVAIVGVLPAAEALSTRPGGRARMGVGREAPSRAAMKLEEAIDWLGVGPEPGDRCVDLGAAPGGWTWALSERRATVIAVDLGRLRPEIARRKNVAYVHASAFNFVPDEPVDWLFCDMAWRPLEVAALLAKWGRNRWARTLVANIKLPMKRKVEMLRRVREILETGGWKDLRTRHLYHDRDEITLTAWQR